MAQGSSQTVPCNQAFPSSLLDFLRDLPEDEPLVKRRRIDAPGETARPIPILRRNLYISRPISPSSSNFDISDGFTRQNVEEHISFSLARAREPRSEPQLVIKQRSSNSAKNKIVFGIDLQPGILTDDVSTIVDISNKTNSKSLRHGEMRVTAEVSAEYKNRSVALSFCFELQWNAGYLFNDAIQNHQLRKLGRRALEFAFQPGPDGTTPSTAQAWTPMDFYDSAFTPSPTSDPDISIDNLSATLYPFQRRTLSWMLQREGVEWSDGGIKEVDAVSSDPPISFRRVSDLQGKECYVSPLFQIITDDLSPFQLFEKSIKGGILAEEMGLGKTLEIISLILLHPRISFDSDILGDSAAEELRQSKATLIVSPEPLRDQWISELSLYAPHLRFMCYPGCKGKDIEAEKALVDDLLQCDVVITTYRVLSQELSYAVEPPKREMRQERRYHRTKSPLVQMRWWRVCLDEAQMIESGVSKAAEVARIIPRINAWGVTGTPVKNSVQDLQGLLIFLRYHPYDQSASIWKSLTTEYKPLFRKLFRSLAIRHTKALVRNELHIPPQHRYVVTMPFTAVEEQYYRSLFTEMLEACDLDAEGNPTTVSWHPEDYTERMGQWLNRLRQAAVHPDVAMRRVLGRNRNMPMRTVEEVLNAMIDQSERSILVDHRGAIALGLTKGQLFENSPRVKEALAIWESLEKEASDVVLSTRQRTREALKELSGEANDDDDLSDMDSEENDREEKDGSNPKGQASEWRRNLRSALELHHRAVFFCANAYYQIRENKEMTVPDSEEFERLKKLEDETYARAKAIRREILAESHGKVMKLVDKISDKASNQSFATIPEMGIGDRRGLESRYVLDSLEELCLSLNEQAGMIDEWREKVIGLLRTQLIDEEDDIETTGEEYSDSTKIQDEMMVYVQMLRAAVADRQDAISGQVNELVRYEMNISEQNAIEKLPPAPELFLKLYQERNKMKPDQMLGSVRGATTALRQLHVPVYGDRDLKGDASRAAVEAEIARDHLPAIQKQVTEQNKAITALEAELELFTSTMNARLGYYRQLQAVSDSVLPYEGTPDDEVIARLTAQETSLRTKLATSESKHRYLLNLKEAGSKSSEPRLCVICQSTFETGVLTVCGHQFCKECITLWFRAHHNCPVCKRQLRASHLHDIVIKPQLLKVHTETLSAPPTKGSARDVGTRKTSIYSELGSNELAAIQDIELEGPSFTTKVDTLVRHLLWLRQSDPGSKSIVYSSFPHFLDILMMAFSRYKIGFSSFNSADGIGRFKYDPGTEVFLLYARAHSSGLNLVNASHVFLCEPLLNTALELQAIARVDRIGQNHETTVWLYLVDGTVEESIYNLSVERRMDHLGRFTKNKSKESTPELLDVTIDAANTLELEQAQLSNLMNKGNQGGEFVQSSDVWRCLFGDAHTRRENRRDDSSDARAENPAVMSFLAAEAAEGRRNGVNGDAGPSSDVNS